MCKGRAMGWRCTQTRLIDARGPPAPNLSMCEYYLFKGIRMRNQSETLESEEATLILEDIHGVSVVIGNLANS